MLLIHLCWWIVPVALSDRNHLLRWAARAVKTDRSIHTVIQKQFPVRGLELHQSARSLVAVENPLFFFGAYVQIVSHTFCMLFFQFTHFHLVIIWNLCITTVCITSQIVLFVFGTEYMFVLLGWVVSERAVSHFPHNCFDSMTRSYTILLSHNSSVRTYLNGFVSAYVCATQKIIIFCSTKLVKFLIDYEYCK